MDGEKVKARSQEEVQSRLLRGKKKRLAESEKGSWHDLPKEETNETQAGASRVKIAALKKIKGLFKATSFLHDEVHASV